jgi:ABC-2 type transport system ATP-binding protein
MSVIKVKNLGRKFQISQSEPGLKGTVKSVFKREYKTIEAVKNVSFEINQGEMVGFIGPNGAGKTTTLKMLSGLLYPSSGEVSVLGFTPFDRKAAFLKQISLVMGNRNLLWSDLPAIETFNLNKEIYEIPNAQYKQISEELIDLLEVEEVIHQQVRKMSLGQRMKCELIASLLHTPKILFLDEPTLGLDVVMQKKMREFIKSYNKKYDATVILTSHYMDDVKEICDRVIIINHGQLVFDDSIENLTKNYAGYKVLIPIFNNGVEENELKKMGELVEFQYPKAVIKVPRDKVKQVAQDLDINEPELESVIREIFEKPVTSLI